MKVKSKNHKKVRTFEPDDIATSVNQAICLDLDRWSLLYPPVEASVADAVERQKTSTLKKYKSNATNDKDLVAKTFRKFLEVNAHMKGYQDVFCPDPNIRFSRKFSLRDKILRRARALCYGSIFIDFDEDEWFHCCGNSSGSSIGVSYEDTSQEAKFTLPISTTEEAKRIFDRYLSFDLKLKDAIEKLNGWPYNITDKYMVVDASRAVTVDKDNTINRMIAVEPTVNMFLQQGLLKMLTQRLRRLSLDFSLLPETHKKLARESSITGRNSTIDFSSASDCVSTGLLQWLLPPRWFHVLNSVRCRRILINNESVELNMFSTMGNAATFPLETIVFWTIAVATYSTLSRDDNSLIPNWDDFKSCSVFGDDCVVPTFCHNAFLEVCASVGFLVNKEKTFTGSCKFRESCGGDYLAGFDVRPYHLRRPTSNKLSALEPWLYIISNSILKKYRSYFGTNAYVYDKKVFQELSSLFKRYELKLKLVPNDFPDDAGLKLSNDEERFLRCYSFRVAPIKRDIHGTYSFTFLRYLYRNKRERDDQLRYCLWLKRPIFSDNVVLTFSIRKVGGYVTAKSHTCFWHVAGVASG